MNNRNVQLGANAFGPRTAAAAGDHKDDKDHKDHKVAPLVVNFDPSSKESAAEINALVVELKEYGKTLDANMNAALDAFAADYIGKRLGHNSQSLKEYNFAGYQEVKNNLKKVYALLKNSDHLDSAFKKRTFTTLIRQLDACGPGLAFSIQIIAKELSADVSVAGWLAKSRYMFVEQIADELMQHPDYQFAQGMAIHMTNGCLRYAQSLGWNLYADDEKSNVRDEHEIKMVVDERMSGDVREAIIARQNYMKRRFGELYTPNSMLECLSMEFVGYFYRSCKQFQEDKKITKDYVNFEAHLNKIFMVLGAKPPLGRVLEIIGSDEKDDQKNEKVKLKDDVTLKLAAKDKLYKIIRPYLLKYLVTENLVEEDAHSIHTLKNGDVLYNSNYNLSDSWVKTKEDAIVAYDEYVKENPNNISSVIKIKFNLNLFDEFIDKLRLQSATYIKPHGYVLEWNDTFLFKRLKQRSPGIDFNDTFSCSSVIYRASQTQPWYRRVVLFVMLLLVFVYIDLMSLLAPKLLTWAAYRSNDAIKKNVVSNPIAAGFLTLLTIPFCIAFSPFIAMYDRYTIYKNRQLGQERQATINRFIEETNQEVEVLRKESTYEKIQAGIQKILGKINSLKTQINHSGSSAFQKDDEKIIAQLDAIAAKVISFTEQPNVHQRFNMTEVPQQPVPSPAIDHKEPPAGSLSVSVSNDHDSFMQPLFSRPSSPRVVK